MGKQDKLLQELKKALMESSKFAVDLPDVPTYQAPKKTSTESIADYLLSHASGKFEYTPPPTTVSTSMDNSKISESDKEKGKRLSMEAAQKALAEANKGKPGEESGGPSVISRLLDVISRPSYAVGSALEAARNEKPVGEILGAAVEGLEGQHKITPSEVGRRHGSIEREGAAGFFKGLGVDIFSDPLTWLPGGALKSAATAPVKAVKAIKSGFKAADEAPDAMEQAAIVEKAIDHVTETKAVADNSLSSAASKQVTDEVLKGGATAAMKAAGATPSTVKASKDLIKDILKKAETAPQQAIQRHSGILEEIMKKGRIPANAPRASMAGKFPLPKPYDARQAQVEKMLDIRKQVNKGDKIVAMARPKPDPVTKPTEFRQAVNAETAALKAEVPTTIPKATIGQTVQKSRVVHGIMSRVATHWGNKDLRPAALDAVASAYAHAELRAAQLRPAFSGTSKEQQKLAFDVASKKISNDLVADNPQVAGLASAIQKSMESVAHSTGLTDDAIRANSVATRSGFVMDEFNDMFKLYGGKKMFLSNGKVKDDLGREVDYSNGIDWLKSWESSKLSGDEVAREIFIFQQAAEQLTRQYAFLDEVASMFGKPKAAGRVAAGHPRLKDVYLDKEIADQLGVALNHMRDMYRPDSGLIKGFREITNIWKTLVTIPNPSHHVTNVFGDFFLSAMAGGVRVTDYALGGRILKSQSPAFRDGSVESMERLIGRGGQAGKVGITEAPGKVVLKTKGGVKLTDEQIYVLAHQRGLLQDFHSVEDIMDAPYSMKMTQGKFNPLHYAGEVSTKEAQWTRISHFVAELRKSKEKNIDIAARDAAHTVRKWHPDGRDLTEFEQKAKLLIPFYSWLRKSTPLILEGAILQPGKISNINKAVYNMNIARGEDVQLNDPFNTQGMWPGWLVNPGTQGSVFAPRLPHMDLATQLTRGPMSFATGALTPFAKIPMEMQLEKRLDTGYAINDKGKYLQQQIPLYSRGKSFSDTESGGDKFFNWATGLNRVEPLTPMQKAYDAAYKKTETSKVEGKKMREWAFNKSLTSDPTKPLPKWVKAMYEKSGGK